MSGDVNVCFWDENCSRFCSVFVFRIKQRCSLTVLPLKITALRLLETFDFSAAFSSPKMSVSGDLNLCFWDEKCQNFVVSSFSGSSSVFSNFFTLENNSTEALRNFWLFCSIWLTKNVGVRGLKLMFLGRELSKFCSVFLFQVQAALFSVLPLKTTAMGLFEILDFPGAFGSPTCPCPVMWMCIFERELLKTF